MKSIVAPLHGPKFLKTVFRPAEQFRLVNSARLLVRAPLQFIRAAVWGFIAGRIQWLTQLCSHPPQDI
jgi:hypothetical protein